MLNSQEPHEGLPSTAVRRSPVAVVILRFKVHHPPLPDNLAVLVDSLSEPSSKTTALLAFPSNASSFILSNSCSSKITALWPPSSATFNERVGLPDPGISRPSSRLTKTSAAFPATRLCQEPIRFLTCSKESIYTSDRSSQSRDPIHNLHPPVLHSHQITSRHEVGEFLR